LGDEFPFHFIATHFGMLDNSRIVFRS
jgi:hypothetical protein